MGGLIAEGLRKDLRIADFWPGPREAFRRRGDEVAEGSRKVAWQSALARSSAEAPLRDAEGSRKQNSRPPYYMGGSIAIFGAYSTPGVKSVNKG